MTRALLQDKVNGETALPTSARPGFRSTEAKGVKTINVSTAEAAVLRAVRSGVHDRAEVLKSARVSLGKARLGAQIRLSLEAAMVSLQTKGLLNELLNAEDSEIFATDEGRTATLSTYSPRISSGRKRRSYRYQRRS